MHFYPPAHNPISTLFSFLLHISQNPFNIFFIGKGVIWKCLSVGFYKDLATNALAFSSDGSLLGVAFNHTVTTWLPDSCELKCSLLHPSHRYPLKFLEFGVGTQCHLLVSASTENVSVWNLLTLTMMWTVAVPVSLLVADSMTPYMAVFTSQGKCTCITYHILKLMTVSF